MGERVTRKPPHLVTAADMRNAEFRWALPSDWVAVVWMRSEGGFTECRTCIEDGGWQLDTSEPELRGRLIFDVGQVVACNQVDNHEED